MRKKLILTVGSRENNEEESFELGVEGWAELDSQTFWGETSQVEGIFCSFNILLGTSRAHLCSWKSRVPADWCWGPVGAVRMDR